MKIICNKNIYIYIYNTNALNVLKELKEKNIKVNCLLTDPPYGIDFQSARVSKEKRKKKILNDKQPYTEFLQLFDLHDILYKDEWSLYIFSRWDVQQEFINKLKEVSNIKTKNVIIWDKVVHGMGDLKTAYGSRYESIIFSSGKDFRFTNKRPTDIIREQRVTPSKLLHSNEKPVNLYKQLLDNSVNKEDFTCLDLFAGSFASAIACIEKGVNYIGVELDTEVYNNGVKRIIKYLEDNNIEHSIDN